MKTEPNEFAFPVKCNEKVHPGLTIREYFAAIVLNGMVSDAMSLHAASLESGKDTHVMALVMGQTAVTFADALIEALNQPPK